MIGKKPVRTCTGFFLHRDLFPGMRIPGRKTEMKGYFLLKSLCASAMIATVCISAEGCFFAQEAC